MTFIYSRWIRCPACKTPFRRFRLYCYWAFENVCDCEWISAKMEDYS